MELRQFRQFIAVAEERHFRRAAARLRMAQPPLSQAIRRVETILGVELFLRDHHSVRLTAAGEVLLTEARRVVWQADQAAERTRRAGAGLTGSLRVTFVSSAGYRYLPRVVRLFREEAPEIELELRELSSTQQLHELRAERTDVGFLVPPFSESGDLEQTVVLQGRFVAALPADHRLARGPAGPGGGGPPLLPLGELAGEPFVLFPPQEAPGIYAQIMGACARAGFTPKVVQIAHQMQTIVNLVAGGLGVALVPAAMGYLCPPEVVYRELAPIPAGPAAAAVAAAVTATAAARASGQRAPRRPARRAPAAPIPPAVPTAFPGYELSAVWRREDRSLLRAHFLRVARAVGQVLS